MLHTKFRGNWPAGSTEEDFRRIFTIYGHGGHLGHVTSIMSSDFHFLQNLVQIGTVVSEKIQFEFKFKLDFLRNYCMYTTLGIDLQYSHIFIYCTKLQITGCNSLSLFQKIGKNNGRLSFFLNLQNGLNEIINYVMFILFLLHIYIRDKILSFLSVVHIFCQKCHDF